MYIQQIITLGSDVWKSESYKIRYCIVLFWFESGKTPSDKAGIEIKADNKWLNLIQNVTKKNYQLDNSAN